MVRVSLHRKSIRNPLIHRVWYADTAIAPLVQGLGTPTVLLPPCCVGLMPHKRLPGAEHLIQSAHIIFSAVIRSEYNGQAILSTTL
jgi:hypothetical protein